MCLYPFEYYAPAWKRYLILQCHCNCKVTGFTDSRAQEGHKTASSDSSACTESRFATLM